MRRNSSLWLAVIVSLSVLTPTWAQTAPVYAVDFVSTAAFGTSMNEAGSVVGTSYTDPGCGWQCLPPLETVVWQGGKRIVLPTLPAFGPYITVASINAQGWVVGFAGYMWTTTHAVVWKPNGTTYDAIDLGTLPGTTTSYATGIDNLGRVVGWSTTSNFPPNGSPFMWSEATGMVDLSAQGFPDDVPLAISPGGTVATQLTWYRLGDPGSVVSMPPAPRGFFVNASAVINDAGDQARFLGTTGGQNLLYLFRFHHEGAGTWQQISSVPTGHLSRAALGSINNAGDITATVGGTGVIAFGPDGLAQSLSNMLSPPYNGAFATMGGPMNAAGQILSQMIIGRSQRLVKLTPAAACTTACNRVTAVQMTGKFIQDPADPGHCTPQAFNHVVTKVSVVDENGSPIKGVKVTGHYLDDYWMDHKLSANTNLQGKAKFVHDGLACVGAVTFLVDSAAKTGRTLDKTTGVLTNYVIPLP